MFTEKAVRKSGLFLPYTIYTERDGFVGFEWKEEEEATTTPKPRSALRRDRWVRVAGSDATSSSRRSRHGRGALRGEAVGRCTIARQSHRRRLPERASFRGDDAKGRRKRRRKRVKRLFYAATRPVRSGVRVRGVVPWT